MSARKASRIRFTANFEANLEAIELFLADGDFPEGFDRLLDELGSRVIPNLERFPTMGRPFMARQPESLEAASKQELLRAMLARLGKSNDIREYVMGDHLLLYAVVPDAVYLLSIHHHKQLSFDFAGFWPDRP